MEEHMAIQSEGGYCPRCGTHHDGNINFCTECGTNLKQGTDRYSEEKKTVAIDLDKKLKKYIRILSDKENISGTIWMTIGIIQIIVGVILIIGIVHTSMSLTDEYSLLLGVILVVLGLVNTSAGNRRKIQAKRVRSPYEGMIEEYENALKGHIFAFMVNILFGAVIGIIGNIYDLSIRRYVLHNSDIFETIIGFTQKKKEQEQGAERKYRLEVKYHPSKKTTKGVIYFLDDEATLHQASPDEPSQHYVTAGRHCINISKGVVTKRVIAVMVNEDTSVTIEDE